VAGYVFDTSAVIAYLYDERGADKVESTLFGGGKVLVPFIALMEVEYKVLRELPVDDAPKQIAVLDSWPIVVAESDARWRHEAARIKAGGKISLADAWVASLALLEDAELVHKDPEFDSISGLKHMRLPYTERRSS
jgi:predicted nucleic acid-binding protein